MIIGGHSHTVVDPNDRSTPTWRVPNAAGDTISVLQTGSSGTYLGEIDIDLDTREVKAQLIPEESRDAQSAERLRDDARRGNLR